MQVVWRAGEAGVTVSEVTEALPGDRHYNTVLTFLRILERKGWVVHKKDTSGRGFLYFHAKSRQQAETEAIRELADRLFGGNVKALAARLKAA